MKKLKDAVRQKSLPKARPAQLLDQAVTPERRGGHLDIGRHIRTHRHRQAAVFSVLAALGLHLFELAVRVGPLLEAGLDLGVQLIAAVVHQVVHDAQALECILAMIDVAFVDPAEVAFAVRLGQRGSTKQYSRDPGAYKDVSESGLALFANQSGTDNANQQ